MQIAMIYRRSKKYVQIVPIAADVCILNRECILFASIFFYPGFTRPAWILERIQFLREVDVDAATRRT